MATKQLEPEYLIGLLRDRGYRPVPYRGPAGECVGVYDSSVLEITIGLLRDARDNGRMYMMDSLLLTMERAARTHWPGQRPAVFWPDLPWPGETEKMP